MSQDRIAAHFQSSLDGLTKAVRSNELLATTHTIARVVADALKSGNKLLLIGNGGSAADAQHIAAEIVGRYKQERAGWAAIALTTDTSALTAIANDYGFEQVFARQVQGLAKRGDVLFALSTSGRSPNILAAIKVARDLGVTTVGFTGAKGESMRASCDHLFVSPTDDTPVIQQVHMMAMHAICDEVEQVLIGATKPK
ncbi:MAG: SIS domain-containing protein [Bradyrhizobiaceae bacterium]|uniref:D-sedoheptulose 7-phosphate isomerase n=1 Tax=unclassified Afipia TaxID=2642050 RepID=UPI0004635BD3|nr:MULTISPECIES: D-sedoheptulose 7-phosphate isomerase [unclassified Afipia]MAH67738.1 sugar isomerase [Afipia sp.]OUX63111.1 MAG: sugar isomerase [Afipia sp. TMED4]RTL76251.1 MAG: SIS domain-containing protein [Bradyrhizobiaceae bacterium]HAO41965.1 SIS domain-containing protein [Afipia sp.]HAQ94247.1 SIS domain-containing protein [Afipia sp.]